MERVQRELVERKRNQNNVGTLLAVAALDFII